MAGSWQHAATNTTQQKETHNNEPAVLVCVQQRTRQVCRRGVLQAAEPEVLPELCAPFVRPRVCMLLFCYSGPGAEHQLSHVISARLQTGSNILLYVLRIVMLLLFSATLGGVQLA